MDINLGTIQIQPKGSWESTVAYEYLNLIRYNNSSYICRSKIGAPTGTLPTDTNYFMLISTDGTTSLDTALTLDEITAIFGSCSSAPAPTGTTSLDTALTLDEITAIFGSCSSAPAP